MKKSHLFILCSMIIAIALIAVICVISLKQDAIGNSFLSGETQASQAIKGRLNSSELKSAHQAIDRKIKNCVTAKFFVNPPPLNVKNLQEVKEKGEKAYFECYQQELSMIKVFATPSDISILMQASKGS